ncbi:MAG: hypothetical protein KAQ90_05250 [Melioribacteraceae bacterium]|nr:hypothetical protein [Melioribacteraceae bacterium]
MRIIDLLKLEKFGNNLSIAEAEWKKALAVAEPDPVVGIRHAVVSGDEHYRIHVAAIPNQVGCHFHKVGNEDYEIVEGNGILYWGIVTIDNGKFTVNWEEPVNVNCGDSFVIPEGYAHQLCKLGDSDLTILFGCPDTHIDDSADRFILPDAPR